MDARFTTAVGRRLPGLLAALILGAPAAAAAETIPERPRGETETMSWRKQISSYAGSAVENLDEFVEVTWRRFARQMGFDEPRHIAAYHGYASSERLWVRGRLLANKPYGGPQDDDTWWDNLQATYNRWESDEVAGATIELEYGGVTQTVTTDDEGYYAAAFDLGPGPHERTVIARHAMEDRVLTAHHRLSLLDDEAELMVVSDMDDTVIHTGITNVLLSAQLTFLNNAKTRKPLVGVGGLYRALTASENGWPVHPIFYLSNSAWNMFDLLRDFLELNNLPEGPLLLRDIGAGSDTSSHKIDTLDRLLRRFPHLPAVLVGDSGQHDAEIYARIAERHPGRVKAIYIRDVDPEDDSEYDGNVEAIIARSRFLGVPFLRVRDSAQIAAHAAGIGLLPEREVPAVETDVEIDRKRETLAAETLIGAAAE